jgi:pimeloyl-ACP methyl ester carboxylesterase
VEVESTTIETSQGRFTVDVAGSPKRPLVILLHGFPQSRYTWRDLVPAIGQAGFYAVAPDQRGYSGGIRPVDSQAYTADLLVGDVLDIIQATGHPGAHLVGHDWGGQVAWLAAAYRPEWVQSLSVLSRPHPAAFARSFTLDPSQSTRSAHHRRFLAPEATDELWADGCARLRAMFDSAGVPEPTAQAYLDNFHERATLDAALNWYRAAPLGPWAPADCPDVAVPTVYVWGDHDTTVSRTAAELTAEHVSGPYRFVEVSGSGHFLTDDGGARGVGESVLANLSRATA